jgi:hypothetical protein
LVVTVAAFVTEAYRVIVESSTLVDVVKTLEVVVAVYVCVVASREVVKSVFKMVLRIVLVVA